MEPPAENASELFPKKIRRSLKKLNKTKEYGIGIAFFCLLEFVRHIFASVPAYKSWPLYAWLVFYAAGMVLGVYMARSTNNQKRS